jgi:hypothetical protein
VEPDFRQLADRHRMRTVEAARFYAEQYLIAADAVISCWDDKAYWLSWRPIRGDPRPSIPPATRA